MKIQKMFTIDRDIVERLSKEDNASALVNLLLFRHYQEPVHQKRDVLLESLERQEAKEEEAKEAESEERWQAYLKDHPPDFQDPEGEYRKGLKEGKWRGIGEYLRILRGLWEDGLRP